MLLPFTGGSDAQKEDEVTRQGCGDAGPGTCQRVQDGHWPVPPGITELPPGLAAGDGYHRQSLALALPPTLICRTPRLTP